MKLLLEADVEPEFWFKPTHDSDDVKGHLENLASKAVLGVTEGSWFDSVCSGKTYGTAKVIQGAVLQKACIARVKNVNQCDLKISRGSYIHSLVQDVVFEDKFDFHAHDLEAGESREAFFDRKVGHLLSASEKFEFLDSYFSQNVVNRTRGAHYVLERCLNANIPVVEIHTFEDEAKTSNVNQHIDEVHRSVENLFASRPRFSKVSIKIYGGPRDEFPHDRFGEIGFLNKSIGFSIGQGTEVFKKFSTRPSPVFEPIKRSFENLRTFLDSKELLEELVY